ncbi:MAG: hypothetical protein ACI4N3_04830 [Alphaproteobacteria bacterium]
MNRRTAKKILNRDGFHWSWYRNDCGLWSLTPLNAKLYFKACKKLKRNPYYDAEWLKLIEGFRKKYNSFFSL